MFRFKDIYHTYINQDPMRIFQDGAIKSAVILFSFLAITSFLDTDKNLIILSILFIANMAGSILIGSVQAKRIAFVLYIFFAISIVNISPYVHSIFETNFMLIVLVVFVAFWSRRFGEAFAVFPVMIIVITCISFIRYPLAKYNHLSFTITAVLISIAFYLLLIRTYKLMKAGDIRYEVKEFVKLFVRTYANIFEKSKYREFSQKDIVGVSSFKYQNINAFKNHGLMFLGKNNQDKWRYLSHNFVVFNRLVSRFLLNYKKLNLNYVNLGVKGGSEAIQLSQDLERIFKKTLFLMLYIQRKADAFDKKVEEIGHLKYKLEMSYIEKYKDDKPKRKHLFDSILILDDMLISLDNIREAYYDLI